MSLPINKKADFCHMEKYSNTANILLLPKCKCFVFENSCEYYEMYKNIT